jgi:hypothetical protein
MVSSMFLELWPAAAPEADNATGIAIWQREYRPATFDGQTDFNFAAQFNQVY